MSLRNVPPVLVTSNVNVTGPGVGLAKTSLSAASPAVLTMSMFGTSVIASSSSLGSSNSGLPASSKTGSPFSSVASPVAPAVFWFTGPTTSTSAVQVTDASGAIGPASSGHSADVIVTSSVGSAVPASSVITRLDRCVPPVLMIT